MTVNHALPAGGLSIKYKYYSKKYGRFSALLRYAGRHSPLLWRLIGRGVTRSYRRRWLEGEGKRRVLNLGGGGNCSDEYLTVDIDARADAYVDLTRPLPFPDECLDAIFCEEAIEHVDLADGRLLLAECRRVLKAGGVMRITTPDLTYFARCVLDTGRETEINNIFYAHQHKHIYTRPSLRQCCREAGFDILEESFYRDPDSRLGHLDTHADRFGEPPETSQFLEIQKPSHVGPHVLDREVAGPA
jgi:predicted SAM-dependent methyltransferase